jgi:hypothetical protein
MSNKQPPLRRPAPLAPPMKKPPVDFWESKTLEELAAEQGVHPIERLEEVLGRGADLWRDEAEWEAFLSALQESRQKEV